MRPVVLSIAGSDPSGGAGIQADLKTIHAHGGFGQAVITLLTVQDTHGVHEVFGVPPDLVERQIRAVVGDTPPAAVKVGALPNAEAVDAVARALSGLDVPLVLDPVLVSSSGKTFADSGIVAALRARLLPGCALVAPNLAEAAVLTGADVGTLEQARWAAQHLVQLGARAALVTGGHLPGAPCDVLQGPDGEVRFAGERIVTRHTHGTGCAYTAAIATRLATRHSLQDAVAGARRWLLRALVGAPGLGGGHGPIDFFAEADP